MENGGFAPVEHTVECRHLKLEYLEFYEVRSIYLNKIYSLIAFSNNNLFL